MGLSNSQPYSILQPGVCTSTTRPTNPYPGQVIFETDTNKTLVWYAISSVFGWYPTWNMPWGRVASALTVTNQGGVGTTVTDITGLSATWTVVNGRIYRTILTLANLLQNTSNGYVQPVIANSSNVALLEPVFTLIAGAEGVLTVQLYETGLAPGSTTRKARIFTHAGTLDVRGSATRVNSIVVEDLGPS